MVRDLSLSRRSSLLWRAGRMVGTGLLCASVLVGCSVLPSEKTSYPGSLYEAAVAGSVPAVETPDETVTVDARPVLEEALRAMEENEKAQRYWYTGFIRNTLEKHLVNSMFDGVVLHPKEAYLINARIAGQPYQYYRYEGVNYIKDEHRWYPIAGDVPLAFDPLEGFEGWLPLLEKAVQLPDATTIAGPSEAYEVRISGRAWVEQATSPLFSELQERLAAGDEELALRLERTVVKMTLWIGKVDRFIHRYQTWTVMPLPDGGYVDQETDVELYRFDDPSLETQQLPTPDSIQDWVDTADQLEAEDELLE